jgi:hypothetical protein
MLSPALLYIHAVMKHTTTTLILRVNALVRLSVVMMSYILFASASFLRGLRRSPSILRSSSRKVNLVSLSESNLLPTRRREFISHECICTPDGVLTKFIIRCSQCLIPYLLALLEGIMSRCISLATINPRDKNVHSAFAFVS